MVNKAIREAVSIILKHEEKIFPIVRQNFLNNFPGYTAFPGGKIDKQDYELQNSSSIENIEQHLLNCLNREGIEELGIDILELYKCGIISNIEYIARAKTPSFNPYRFNTYFFLIHLNEIPNIKIDKNEAYSANWLTPSQILKEYNNGLRLMVPPVRWIIERLDSPIKEPLFFEDRFSHDEVPYTESINEIIQIMPLSDTLPPADRTNAFIIGDLLVDPSPKDEIELKKFLNVVSRYSLKNIFLTHHHRDHYQNLLKVVDRLNLPVLLSSDTYQRILKKEGNDFFNSINTKIVSNAEIVTKWLGKDVVTMSVPGHDEGQLALYPITKEWFLAGDLFQGIGTVVISTDEGDMIKYFNTLESVIKLDPKCVIPSHGIALGGTYILQKTLKHRKMREKQVYELAKEGKSIDEMLSLIYPDLASSLLKLAKLNIESHLIKLRKENLL